MIVSAIGRLNEAEIEGTAAAIAVLVAVIASRDEEGQRELRPVDADIGRGHQKNAARRPNTSGRATPPLATKMFLRV